MTVSKRMWISNVLIQKPVFKCYLLYVDEYNNNNAYASPAEVKYHHTHQGTIVGDL